MVEKNGHTITASLVTSLLLCIIMFIIIIITYYLGNTN